jgi:hypothetical protein
MPRAGGIRVMVKFDCPKCFEPLSFGEERRGDDVRCPSCKALLRLPAKRTPATKPVAAARSSTPDRPAKPKPPPPDADHVIDAAEVVRTPKKQKKRRRKSESFEMPEWIVPLGLFVCAFVVNASIALRGGGNDGKRLLIFSLIGLVVAVPSTIAGMFVAAAALDINFGNVFTAAVKVAAITTVVQCIYLFGQLGSADGSAMIVLVLALPVYYGMFCWLFALNFGEALWATFIIGTVQKCVNLVVTLAIMGAYFKAAANGL